VAIANTSGTALSVAGNVTGGNILTAGLISATGNVNGSNLGTAGTALISGAMSLSGSTVLYSSGTNNDSIGTNKTTGTITIGSAGGTGTLTLGQSTANQTVNIATGILPGGITKAINIGTGGTSTSQTNITIGTATAPTTTTFQAATTVAIANTGALALSVAGTVTGANVLTSGIVSATGNITGGNLSVSTGTITVGNIVNANGNAVGNIGSSSTYFNTVFAKATSAQYADLAEMYAADQEYAPGTVLSFGGSAEVTQSTQDADPVVAGIVSTNPAYCMNSGLQATNPVALTLVGRVPCQVQGPISVGSMMVSAGNGLARAELAPAMGTVIGKALEAFDGDVGVIEVVVGRL
jgi:hypothetical protein